MEALFTSTSAVCVTGLTVVDTPTYWSGFGQAVILGLIQVGGFGIMTLASLLGLLVARRMGLRSRLTAAAETRSVGIGDVRRVLLGVAIISAAVESIAAVALTARFALAYDEPFPRAVYLGVFHSVSAFNNAGFALYSDNLIGFATDSVDLPAHRVGGDHRWDRVPGDPGAAAGAAPARSVECAHQDHAVDDRAAAGVVHRVRHRRRVVQPAHLGALPGLGGCWPGFSRP